jgi:hypothetical protein
MAEARFKIGARVYTTAALDEISLKDLIVFGREAEAIGLPAKWSDIERIASEAADLPDGEEHPDALLLVGVTIWASRRAAGDDVTFEQSIDFPLKDLSFLPSPTDREEPGPTKARKGKKHTSASSPSTGSSPVSALPVSDTTPRETSTTSEERSQNAS